MFLMPRRPITEPSLSPKKNLIRELFHKCLFATDSGHKHFHDDLFKQHQLPPKKALESNPLRALPALERWRVWAPPFISPMGPPRRSWAGPAPLLPRSPVL